MPAAILFRGHAHYPPGSPHRKCGTDWRKCIDSHFTHLYDRLDGFSHIYLSSYDTPFRNEIEYGYEPKKAFWETGNNTQRGIMSKGLELIANSGISYDLIVTCRFDLELLSSPLPLPGMNPRKFNFLWREWTQDFWDKNRGVADTMHFFPGRYLEGFRKVIDPGEGDMHYIYPRLAAEIGEDNICTIFGDKIHNSNPDWDKEPNPIYRIVRVF